MVKKLKNIFGFVLLFWCGSRFFVSLLCFIWAWKLAVTILCLWACSCVVTLLWLITESVLNNGNKK